MQNPFDRDDLEALRWRLDTYGNLPTNLVHDLIDAVELLQDRAETYATAYGELNRQTLDESRDLVQSVLIGLLHRNESDK